MNAPPDDMCSACAEPAVTRDEAALRAAELLDELAGVGAKDPNMAMARAHLRLLEERGGEKRLRALAAALRGAPTNAPRVCSGCGCTDDDCRQCIERTGVACTWVTDDMCSACADPGAKANLPASSLTFTQEVLELVVAEAKRRQTVVAGVAAEIEQLEAPPDYVLSALAAKLRTAIDPGVVADGPPTTDETLTSKVTPLERVLVARLLEMCDAGLTTLKSREELRARVAELEQRIANQRAAAEVLDASLTEANAHVEMGVARVAELEHELAKMTDSLESRRELHHETKRELAELERELASVRAWAAKSIRRVDAIADKLEHPNFAKGTFRSVPQLARALRLAFNEPARAPRVTRSGKRAASTSVQDAERPFVSASDVAAFATKLGERLGAQTPAARQADSAGKRPDSAEHGTPSETPAAVPAARQTARAAEKEAEKASFEARCRRREANHARGPPAAPSPRDIAHAPAKIAQKKKQPGKRGVRRKSSRKRGSS